MYNLLKTIRDKIFEQYQNIVNEINVNDTSTSVTGMNSCERANSTYLNHHHEHVIPGDLRIITNLKIRNTTSKDPYCKEPTTSNWKRCKDNIMDGLDILVKGKIEI